MEQEATPHGLVSKDSTGPRTAERIPLSIRIPGAWSPTTDGADRQWPEARRRAIERAERACEHCGAADGLHVHHLVHRQHGGNHSDENLQVLCAACHRSAHADDHLHAVEFTATMRDLHDRRLDSLAPFLAACSFGYRGLT